MNLFSKPKVGTALIEDTIAQFESYADKLELGAAQNAETVASNISTINALAAENSGLNLAKDRAMTTAAKLRQLVS